jgi:hypothetical protein
LHSLKALSNVEGQSRKVYPKPGTHNKILTLLKQQALDPVFLCAFAALREIGLDLGVEVVLRKDPEVQLV